MKLIMGYLRSIKTLNKVLFLTPITPVKMYYKGRNTHSSSSSLRTDLIREFHKISLGGHAGTHKTFMRISARVMANDEKLCQSV